MKTPDPADHDKVDDLFRSLTNVTPTQEQVDRIESLRAHAKAYGEQIILTTNNSRERSLALTHLEDSTMWAVKGIVLNG